VNGLLFPPGDAEALADQIVTYFKNNLGECFADGISKTYGRNTECQLVAIIEQLINGSD